MEASLQRLVTASLDERPGQIVQTGRCGEPLGSHFHHCPTNQQDGPEFQVCVSEQIQSCLKMYAGFVIRSFAPVAQTQLTSGFSSAEGVTKSFEAFPALRQQVFCGVLIPDSLDRSRAPGRQRTRAKQQVCGNGIV